MRYLIITSDGSLGQLEDINPALLQQVEAGEISIARFERDRFEYLVAGSRAVNDPGNSFDEVRQDQAVAGRIYEVAGWEAMEIFDVNTGRFSRADAGKPTVIDEEKVQREFRSAGETYEDRRDNYLAEQDKEKGGDQ